jgi:hypothetical protein
MQNLSLSEQIEKVFDDLKICDEQRESILALTDPLKVKDVSTWEHSARVGLRNIEVGRYTHIDDPKTWFYVGFMHDVGKALTDPESLKKTEGFSQKDRRELDRHVMDTYRLLNGIHDFTARASLWHHYFCSGYPSKRIMPKPNSDFSEATELKAMYLGRFTGIVDFYDAITHRKNDKFSSDGTPSLPSKKQAREILEGANEDQVYFIGEMYNGGIFE